MFLTKMGVFPIYSEHSSKNPYYLSEQYSENYFS